MVSVQVALGGWVSTNYAVLACTTFPPARAAGGRRWIFPRPLNCMPAGRAQDGSHIGFAALTAIHYVHRLFAYAVLGVLVVLAWRLRCDTAAQADTIAQARQRAVQVRWLLGLAGLQLLTGLSNVVLDWPWWRPCCTPAVLPPWWWWWSGRSIPAGWWCPEPTAHSPPRWSCRNPKA